MVIIQRAKINPKSLTYADVMQLQRTIGNRAVGRLLSEIGLIPSTAKQAPPVQRQEIPEKEEPLQGKVTGTIQRQEIPQEEEPLQGKMIETIQRQEIPEEEKPLQGKFESEPEQETCFSCSTPPIQQEKENRTGMPDDFKSGVENLSGIDMSDVRVHYNSSKPAEVRALAYTQGTDIHVAPEQERYLPHEAWHTVQEAQGSVKPTLQLKGAAINDDLGLEKEADVMGRKASQMIYNLQYMECTDELPKTVKKRNRLAQSQAMRNNTLVQRKIIWRNVDFFEEMGEDPKPPIQSLNPQDERDYSETKMLIEELKSRYNGNKFPQGLVEGLKEKLKKPIITYVDVRTAITYVEKDLKLASTEKLESAPRTKVELFIKDLKAHRGFYQWEAGGHQAFTECLNPETPSESNLLPDAKINCWEAVLVSAARAGLVDVGKLKNLYSGSKDSQTAVFNMIISYGVTEIKLQEGADRRNEIKAGDVIMIDGPDGPLHHVVAALKANPEDYSKIEVMSLWSGVTGGSFNQAILDELLSPFITSIRYSTFPMSQMPLQ